MNRTLWIGTGWKMNKTRAEARRYAEALAEHLEANPSSARLFVVPPATAIATVSDILAGSGVTVGAQTMHWAESGAYTGELSAAMIKDAGATLVELGHSERRSMFNETDDDVNRKVLTAIAHGLTPLVCVGETGGERAHGAAAEAVARQVKIALSGLPRDTGGSIVIAYEPVWAIGETGKAASADYAGHIHSVIRAAANTCLDSLDARLSVIYGGSVDDSNAADFLAEPEIDGLFVGRHAWEAGNFIRLIKTAASFTPDRLP